jgi:AcrR family transcriptional regulator
LVVVVIMSTPRAVNRTFCLTLDSKQTVLYCQPVTDTNAPSKPAARERLLATAAELFYEEGVQSVGVDKVTERAGVTKASMYKIFGSKDGLVRAYLEQRHEQTKARMDAELADRFATPRDKLLGVFEVQGQVFSDRGFRGCAFVSASAEAQPGSSVEKATRDYRAWLHDLFLDLARQAGAEYPQSLAEQLTLLYDGAGISAWMDDNPKVALASGAIAKSLIDNAIPAPA